MYQCPVASEPLTGEGRNLGRFIVVHFIQSVMITLTHFDTRTNEVLETQEQIENSIAEYFFPNTRFAIGKVYPEDVREEDLGERDNGMSLQFANGKRMYFSDKEVRKEIYPVESDGAVYGSLPFTSCKDFLEIKNALVLVIDHETGMSSADGKNNVVAPESGKHLVSDSWGQISQKLATQMTGDKHTPFQFRLGIKPQEGSPVYRIGKGTFAPYNPSDTTLEGYEKILGKYDLIIPTSSFKGRKGETAIAPGEYTLTVGVALKVQAEYSRFSLGTQILCNYPEGVKTDIFPVVDAQAEELARVQNDSRALARRFVESERARRNGSEQTPEDEEGLIDDWIGTAFEVELSTTSGKSERIPLSELIEEDLANHSQFLEHPKVVASLRQFVVNEWRDIATGRSIRVNSGLAQPCRKLKEDEVCIPILPDGEKVIVTRTPTLNSNGVLVMTNKLLPELGSMHGVVYIHPDTAARHLQGDFDGDRLAFERASRFPTLAAEIAKSLRPENRYPEVYKQDKIAYEGTFPQIAIKVMDSQIGTIANSIQRSISLRWEAVLLPEERRKNYVMTAARYYKGILEASEEGKLMIPTQYQDKLERLAALSKDKDLNPDQIEGALEDFQEIQREIVGELGHELQVAADGPKSAARPNEVVLELCNKLRGPFKVSWIPEKRNPEVFLSRPMRTKNHSPIDLLIATANQYWESSELKMQPVQKFLHLFDGVPVTQNQLEVAREIRDEYNRLSHIVAKYDSELKAGNTSPRIILASSKSGRSVEVTNLHLFTSPDSPIRNQETMDVQIVKVQKQIRGIEPNRYLVLVRNEGGSFQPLGTVSYVTEQKYRGELYSGMKMTGAFAQMKHGITKTEREAAGANVQNYIEMVRRSTPLEERPQMAAALALVSWQRTDNQHKRGSAPLSIFPEEVMARLDTLRAKELVVTGTRYEANQYLGHTFDNERATITIAVDENHESRTFGRKLVMVDGLRLGPLSSESPELPVGTRIEGSVTSDLPNAVTLTSPKGNTLTVKQLGQGDLKHIIWNGEKANVTLKRTFHVDPRTNRERMQVIASLGSSKLGVLDRKDAQKLLQQTNLSKRGSFTLPMTLKSDASSSVRIKLDPDTVVYPWDKEKHKEYERLVGRELYERYAKKVTERESFANAQQRDIDVGVALLMLRDLPNSNDSMRTVALALSQSDCVKELKETLPPAQYERYAKSYVQDVRNEAVSYLQLHNSPEREQFEEVKQVQEKPKEQEIIP